MEGALYRGGAGLGWPGLCTLGIEKGELIAGASGASADYKVRFKEWQSHAGWGAEGRATLWDGAAPWGGLRSALCQWAPDPAHRLLQTDPGAWAGPCRRRQPPVLGNATAETPRCGLAGSRYLGQGRAAISASWSGAAGQAPSQCGGRKQCQGCSLQRGSPGCVRGWRGGRGKGSQASCKLLLTKIPFKRQTLVPLQHPAPQQSSCAATSAPRGSRGLAHSTH